jgi:hypothetical protein
MGTRAFLPALVLLCGSLAAAGPPMRGDDNELRRSAVTGGGSAASSGSHALNSAAGEPQTAERASGSYRMVPGAMALFSFPGKTPDLTKVQALTASATMQWTIAGYDGALGALQNGTSYYVRIASYTVPDTFDFSHSELWFTTGPAGTSPSAVVSSVTAGLFANTTWYQTLFTLDADGNVSFMSNMSTFTTLARQPSLLADTYLFVHETSATLNWHRFPTGVVSSDTARGFLLEASSTNFGALSPGGIVLSSATTQVAASTLTVQGLDLGTTWYFRVGSLNWSSDANFAQLPRLNFEIQPSTFGISFGTINLGVAQSTVSISSMVVYNRGNLPVTLRLFAATSTAGGSPWALGTAPDLEQVMLQGVWNSFVPDTNAFDDALVSSTQTSTGTLFAGDQTGVLIPPGQARTMWFQLWLPTSTVAITKQSFYVNVIAVYP